LLALAEERGVVIPIIRDALDELLDREREHAKHELTESMRSLEVQVAGLESALSTLQMALNIERSKTIDLPNVLRAVN
jgi:hypothetical protein